MAALLGCGLLVACVTQHGDDNAFEVDTAGSTGASSTGAETTTSSSSDTSPGTDTSSTTQSSTTDTTATGDTGPQGCTADEVCLTPPPGGWLGPIAVLRQDVGGPTAECGERYPQAGLTLLEGFVDPGPAVCDCTCDLNFSNYCTSYFYSYTDNACTSGGFYNQMPTDCQNIAVNGSATFYMYQQGNPYCQANKTEEFPEPAWQAEVRSCQGAQLGAECNGGDGVCTPVAPEGFEQKLCIFAQEQTACPPGDYSERIEMYSGIEDTRDCTNCTCGQGTGTCAGTLQVFDAADCGGNMVGEAPQSGCSGAVTSGVSVGVNHTGTSNCPVQQMAEATGEITPTGLFTYCCQP